MFQPKQNQLRHHFIKQIFRLEHPRKTTGADDVGSLPRERLAGELADGWAPFLLPLSGLDASLQLLREGAARTDPGGEFAGRPAPGS